MGEDQRVIEVGEGGERDVVSKEETTLVVNDGELVVAGMCSRAVEIIEDTKSASE